MLARRLTKQKAVATTCLRFDPKSFQQMAGLVAYYNEYLFHYFYISHNEELGRCVQIHTCDDGTSSYPLGSEPIPIPEGELYLRAVFDECKLQFAWSTDGEGFQNVGPVLDASILSDDYGNHWGFTGTFVGLACQDLAGTRLPAEFDFLELNSNLKAISQCLLSA